MPDLLDGVTYALTVRQPYADLIVSGIKPVENRSWQPPPPLPQWWECPRCSTRCQYPPAGLCHSVAGPDGFCGGGPVEDGPFPFTVAIHAAAKPAGAEAATAWRARCREMGLCDDAPTTLGAIVGVATITGCHHADDCRRDRPAEDCSSVADLTCSRWAEPGDLWHWTLDDAQALDQPIAAKGRLGLWKLDEAVTADV